MSVTAVSPFPAATTFAAAMRPDSGRQANAGATAANGQLSDEERRVAAQMQLRDREVRTHEMAHMAAGGGLVRSGATYSFERGPDGALYAVGGEVSIDTSPGNTPEETIERAQQIRAAALAPASPSPQDLSVAAAASQMENQARIELAASRRDENVDALAPTGTQPTRNDSDRITRIALDPNSIGGLVDTFA